MHLSSLTVEGL